MMKKYLSNLRNSDLLYGILLLLVGAVAYLLLVKRLGLYGDDWILIFDAHTQGPGFLKVYFSSDRPGRYYLMSIVYWAFGDHLIYYHLSAFLFRYLGALAFYWLLNMVWKQNKLPNFLMALFFLIYPGFLNQVQPVDYQSHILSLCLAVVSIALTVKAVSSHPIAQKIIFSLMAIGTGWCYLALIEFHIGLEASRLLFILLLAWQENDLPIMRRVMKSILQWLPFAIIPLGFLIWRIFIFQNTRPATNIGLQLGTVIGSPLLVGSHWLLNVFYSSVNVLISGWIVPLYNIFIMGGFRLKDTVVIITIAFIAVLIVFLALFIQKKYFKDDQLDKRNPGWVIQALCFGFLSSVMSIIPIAVVNRSADLGYSRYMVAGALGASMMLVAILFLLSSTRVRNILIGTIVFISVSTHTANTINHVYQADSLRDFWWQVGWRAPSIEAGTNLVATYSLMEAPEDYDIWGPANLIYFPEEQETVPIKVQLPASLPTGDTIINIIGHGNGRDRDRRGNLVHEDFSAVLVLTQPTTGSCVRILDGSMPELSPLDSYGTMLIAPYSLIGNVNWEPTSPVIPTTIFGQEPEHRWCYYYEKAELASQMGDWASVIALGEEAAAKGFSPLDPVEWTPFLRAYVATRQMDVLEPYHGVMNETPFIRNQTCQILKQTANETRPGDLELLTYIDDNFCHLP